MKFFHYKALALSLFFFAGPVIADGNTLLKSCQIYIDNPSGVNNIDDAFAHSFCYGVLRTYKQSLQVVTKFRIDGAVSSDMTMFDNCSFDEVYSETQLARVLVKYLKEHPENLHFWNITLIDMAMDEYFPCS